MTKKQFYDWQTVGGGADVMRFVDALAKDDVLWFGIDGIAVNHWAADQMLTLDVDFVVAADSIELTTEDGYRGFAERGVAADVHGILMRVASLEDTLTGKLRAYSDPKRRQSKRLKDLADIARLVESHPELRNQLGPELTEKINDL